MKKKLSILMFLFLIVATLNSCNELDTSDTLDFGVKSENASAFDKNVLKSNSNYLNKTFDLFTEEDRELFYQDMDKMDKFIFLKDGQYKLLTDDFKKIGVSSDVFEYFKNIMTSTNKDMEKIDVIPIDDKRYTVKKVESGKSD